MILTPTILFPKSQFLNLAIRSHWNSSAYLNMSLYRLAIFLVNQGSQFSSIWI